MPRLGGVTHRVAGDRIEAGTLLAAGAITGGEVEVSGVRPDYLEAVLEKLREASVELVVEGDRVRAAAPERPTGVQVRTAPYPGFPTDMQAQTMALLTVALRRMGADITVDGRTAFIRGVRSLAGASVMATDLRASASLVLAGLAARGDTHVLRVYHIDRGYDRIEEKLAALGGRIRRLRD